MPTMLNNLPVQLTSFIGRDQEIPEVKRLLTTTRLLTLTGSGGTGKTRLSLQVAAEVLDAFNDGIWFIELAPLSDPGLVPVTIASVLGVREEPGRPLLATLLDWLRPKQLLLILDNCEHLIEACAKFADAALHASLETRILATSREALGIAGELAWRVPSLPGPNTSESVNIAQLEQYAAVQLFIERASFALPAFAVTNVNAAAVAQICYRLDGIPLAIELAAARMKAMRVEQIAERLDDRFRLLTGGSRTAVARQQTLRGTIDWSHSLLSEPERGLLRRLSVFAGGWTLDAAEAVCSDEVGPGRLPRGSAEEPPVPGQPQGLPLRQAVVLDLLTHLVEKSLVVLDEQAAEPRYRMLETIRQYAREKLMDANESERLRDRHLAFFLTLAESAEPQLQLAHSAEWMPRLESEHDNLRSALEWACEREPETARWLAGLLREFWKAGDHLNEGHAWCQRVLESGEPPAATRGVALALLGEGELCAYLYSFEEARTVLERSADIWRTLDDQARLAESMFWLAYTKIHEGQPEDACSLFETNESLFRQCADRVTLAMALSYWGRSLANAGGDYAAAKALHEEGLKVGRRLKSPTVLGTIYMNLGYWSTLQGDYEAARHYHMEGLVWRRRAGARWDISTSSMHVADMALLLGDYGQAGTLYAEALALNQAIGAEQSANFFLGRMGYLALREGDTEQAAALFAESLEALLERDNQYGIGQVLVGYAELRRVQGRVEQGVQLLAAPVLIPAASKRTAAYFVRIAHERSVAAARAQLDEATFNAAWEAGSKLTREQAIELAQTEPPVSPIQATPVGPTAAQAVSGAITARELEVLRLLAQGLTNAQIAEQLVLSKRTVHAHLRSIYGKLDVTTRTAAARAALDYKLV